MRRWALAPLCVLSAAAALVVAGSAGGATQTVTFDDVSPNTVVSDEYQESHGVTFAAVPSWRPVVKAFPDKAHSGSQVGVYTCGAPEGCGEKRGSRGSLRDRSEPLPLVQMRWTLAYGPGSVKAT